KAKEIVAFYLGGMGEYYPQMLKAFGWGDEVDRIVELYADKATRAQAAEAVPEGMIEALSVTGDPAECVAELNRRRRFGIDLPILNLPVGLPWPMVELFLKAMAGQL
ncbi:MAG: LLM class flavin-dependent oxidoreductase, partial [Myxococcales bacterium]|nr:LLM class flavin-dependent oxidoreductase [Myxococcales bacterium]